MRIFPEKLKGYVPEKVNDNDQHNRDKETTKLLNNAKRPVVLIGSGVRSAGAVEELKKFIEENQIPLVYRFSARYIWFRRKTFNRFYRIYGLFMSG